MLNAEYIVYCVIDSTVKTSDLLETCSTCDDDVDGNQGTTDTSVNICHNTNYIINIFLHKRYDAFNGFQWDWNRNSVVQALINVYQRKSHSRQRLIQSAYSCINIKPRNSNSQQKVIYLDISIYLYIFHSNFQYTSHNLCETETSMLCCVSIIYENGSHN